MDLREAKILADVEKMEADKSYCWSTDYIYHDGDRPIKAEVYGFKNYYEDIEFFEYVDPDLKNEIIADVMREFGLLAPDQ